MSCQASDHTTKAETTNTEPAKLEKSFGQLNAQIVFNLHYQPDQSSVNDAPGTYLVTWDWETVSAFSNIFLDPIRSTRQQGLYSHRRQEGIMLQPTVSRHWISQQAKYQRSHWTEIATPSESRDIEWIFNSVR